MASDVEIYHILHIDRLPSVLHNGYLFADSVISQRSNAGSIIGMPCIKQRRLGLPLGTRPELRVGQCVPFYFCARSVMLYVIHKGSSPDLPYKGGQEPIVHLVFKMSDVIDWAKRNKHYWAFTDRNAGTSYFHDFNTLDDLKKLNFNAINATSWQNCKEEKQAEFLVEEKVPFSLISKIGVIDEQRRASVAEMFHNTRYAPSILVKKGWYY